MTMPSEAQSPECFTSADGTRISALRCGSGAPLVFVHGSATDRNRWAATAAALAPRFEVHTYDRRGRGESGDAQPYSLERESEDLVAALRSLGTPANVVAHSYGALCALQAAPAAAGLLRSLVLYEPPLRPEVSVDEGLIRRLWSLLRSGDHGSLVSTFLIEATRLSETQLAQLRQKPTWAARVAEAATIPRELAAQNAYDFVPGAFRSVRLPILLLLGGASPPPFRAAAERLVRDLPHARLAILPGQGHVAMDSAPDLFLSTVLQFLDGSSAP